MPRGGFRPGAGRPKGSVGGSGPCLAVRALEIGPADVKFKSAMDFAMKVINDPAAEMSDKIKLAVAILPYQHPRLAEVGQGKKADAEDRAKVAATGRFAPAAAPTLVVSNG